MAKKNVGVYQNEKGFWEYRFVVSINGKRISRRKSTDEYGNHFKTKKEAVAAREADIVNWVLISNIIICVTLTERLWRR